MISGCNLFHSSIRI